MPQTIKIDRDFGGLDLRDPAQAAKVQRAVGFAQSLNDPHLIQEGTEDLDVETPSGETVTVTVPKGMSDRDVRNTLRSKQPDLFKEPERGVLKTAWDDLKGLWPEGPDGMRKKFDQMTPQERKQTLAAVRMSPTERAQAAIARRQAAGHGAAYSYGATLAENVLPVNVEGMEQAAEEGKPREVIGHALGGAAAAVGPDLAFHALPPTAEVLGSSTKALREGAGRLLRDPELSALEYPKSPRSLKGPVKALAQLEVIGTKAPEVINQLVPAHPEAPTSLEGARVNRLKLNQRVREAARPPAGPAEGAAQLPRGTQEPHLPGDEPPETLVVPEPRPTRPEDRPGSAWSVPRESLPGRAKAGEPGAADVMRQVGDRPVLFEPREGTGYPGAREKVDLAGAGREAPPDLPEFKMTTDSNGTRWAEAPDGVKVSVPKSVGEDALNGYVDQKLTEQREMRRNLGAQPTGRNALAGRGSQGPEGLASQTPAAQGEAAGRAENAAAKRARGKDRFDARPGGNVMAQHVNERPSTMGEAPAEEPLDPEMHSMAEDIAGMRLTEDQARNVLRRDQERMAVGEVLKEKRGPKTDVIQDIRNAAAKRRAEDAEPARSPSAAQQLGEHGRAPTDAEITDLGRRVGAAKTSEELLRIQEDWHTRFPSDTGRRFFENTKGLKRPRPNGGKKR